MTKTELEVSNNELNEKNNYLSAEIEQLSKKITMLEKENLALNAKKDMYDKVTLKPKSTGEAVLEQEKIRLENESLKQQNKSLMVLINTRISQLETSLNLFQNLKDSITSALSLGETIFNRTMADLKEEQNKIKGE